jgi:hypothetical protein
MMPRAFLATARGATLALAAAALAAGLAARAAQPPAARADAPATADADALRFDMVKTGLFVIRGGGGNSLLRFSNTGLILVDGKAAGHYRPLMSQVHKLDKLADLPLRVLLLTGDNPARAGTTADFVKARVAVLAHESAFHSRAPASPDALPTSTFANDYTLRLGGVEARLVHVGPAFGDADTAVLFPDLKVLAVGDLYTAGAPVPDYAAGGSLAGWAAAVDQLLKLDFDVVVPADGPPVKRADLEAFGAKLHTLTTRAQALVHEGVPKAEMIAKLKTDDLGWRVDVSGDALDRFYAEMR